MTIFVSIQSIVWFIDDLTSSDLNGDQHLDIKWNRSQRIGII